MCGLVGTYKGPDQLVADGVVALRHRGPDGEGIEQEGPTIHGHTRLALWDLTTASAQPFRYNGGLLSYNGELWDHPRLRDELENLGHHFRTTGDTEVVAAALAEWGTDALPKLEGMWALAWSHKGKHIVARDRFGKVPIYAARSKGWFAWASERKALGNLRGAASAIPPGSWLDVTTGLIHRFYAVPTVHYDPNRVLVDLENGVRRRLAADAPVCCLVSGGIDSSLILALAKRQRPDVVAFTAVYDPASKDLAAARALCQNLAVPLTEVPVGEITVEDLREAAWAIEIASKAQIEIAALCIPLARQIAREGYKAALSGEAADELFGGYGNMCIKASGGDDEQWREIRRYHLAKMARGNFVRCNKAFLAEGVECRLPFMERPLVEGVLSLSKRDCPAGKKLLKRIAAGIIPEGVIRRPKLAFQQGAGFSQRVGQLIANPIRFYNAEITLKFGRLVRD